MLLTAFTIFYVYIFHVVFTKVYWKGDPRMTTQPRFRSTAMVSGILVTAVALGILVAHVQQTAQRHSRAGNTRPNASHPPLLVDAVTVRTEKVLQTNTLSGQVEPFRTATIAAEVAERVLNRPVQRG